MIFNTGRTHQGWKVNVQTGISRYGFGIMEVIYHYGFGVPLCKLTYIGGTSPHTPYSKYLCFFRVSCQSSTNKGGVFTMESQGFPRMRLRGYFQNSEDASLALGTLVDLQGAFWAFLHGKLCSHEANHKPLVPCPCEKTGPRTPDLDDANPNW